MLTSFGKILRKLCLDHSERLLDMAKKLDISVAFLSSVEIGKKSVPVGQKIIELYALDQEKALLLRKAAYACRKSFTIKTSDRLRREAVGMFSRFIDIFTQEDLEKFKQIPEVIRESNREKNATFVEKC
ncbi:MULTISPECIES: XRE family transcriptional regulator [unclassified Bartonella]|uniref:XRE family transcriptional regulator n=1 Tax=unclassified Bartonella TaxID=2645622 RepID=UPI0035D132A7